MRRAAAGLARHPRSAQRGLSLVEAAVAMVIVGVATAVLWQAVGGGRLKERQAHAGAALQRAEAAVLAFVAVHHRFPCPAVQPDGRETCGTRPSTGFLPHLTLGLPEAGDPRARYSVHPVIAAADSRFTVLVNDQTIGSGGAPRAVPVALKTLLTADYDGLLDVCEGLSRAAAPGSAAFTLEQASDDAGRAATWVMAPAKREVSEARVSDHLGCRALVAVSGRGQFNAHLAAAVMSQATQDHRVQSEVAYALNYLNLSEGVWSLANGMYAAMKNWSKLIQTSSALDANIWINPVPFISLHAKAITDRAVELVGVAARASNLARYLDNLQNAQDNRAAHHELARDTLDLYASTTRHALIGSTSAWFLREQRQAPGIPAGLGVATDAGLNRAAQSLTESGQAGADALGRGDLLSPYTRMPEATDRGEARKQRGG